MKFGAPVLHLSLVVFCMGASLSACAPSKPAASPVMAAPLATVPLTRTLSPVAITSLEPTTTPTSALKSGAPAARVTPTSTPRPTPGSEDWKSLPVTPVLSQRALTILADGVEKGSNPRVFSKVGDCESRTTWFLGDFDAGPKQYSLGPHPELQAVIDYYAGSFSRASAAAKPAFNTASLLTPFWADPKVCRSGETPLACEYRTNRPSLAFIMLGTNDVSHQENFEKNMRQIIEFSIEQGVLPVLATKADNLEGDYSINASIARLAAEYDLPLWNYWAALQSLPDKGLQEDKAHLTYAPPRFDDPQAMRRAWPIRNLNALQILQIVMKAANP